MRRRLQLGVPVLNRGDLLLRLVASIDVPADVLVVVNSIGPTDDSVAAAVDELERTKRSEVNVSIVRVEGNLGVAGSWNFILDHFGGDCVISNSDIEFAPGVLVWFCVGGRGIFARAARIRPRPVATLAVYAYLGEVDRGRCRQAIDAVGQCRRTSDFPTKVAALTGFEPVYQP